MCIELLEEKLNARIETPGITVSVKQTKGGWMRVDVQSARGRIHRKIGSPGSDEERLCSAIALLGIKIRPRIRPCSGPKGGRPPKSGRQIGPRLPGAG